MKREFTNLQILHHKKTQSMTAFFWERNPSTSMNKHEKETEAKGGIVRYHSRESMDSLNKGLLRRGLAAVSFIGYRELTLSNR